MKSLFGSQFTTEVKKKKKRHPKTTRKREK
jgi:hypothetical protein